MGFTVEITPKALRDAIDILRWTVKRRGSQAGTRWRQCLMRIINCLARPPLRGKLAPEEFPVEVREEFFGHIPNVYRVLFTVEVDTVVVLHIRKGRRS